MIESGQIFASSWMMLRHDSCGRIRQARQAPSSRLSTSLKDCQQATLTSNHSRQTHHVHNNNDRRLRRQDRATEPALSARSPPSVSHVTTFYAAHRRVLGIHSFSLALLRKLLWDVSTSHFLSQQHSRSSDAAQTQIAATKS